MRIVRQLLGAAIARVATDPALASRMVANARRRVAQFSARNTMEKTVEVYRQVLGKMGRDAAER